MGFDGTTITYVASAGDWGAGIVRLRRGSRWWPLSWLIPILFGLFGMYRMATGDVVAIALLFGAAFMFMALNSAWFNGVLIKRQLKSMVGQTSTITLAEDGLRYKAGPATGTLDWDAVHDVIVDRRVVMVTRDKAVSWAIIPKSAFDDDGQIEAFQTEIRRRRDLARSPSRGR